MTSLFPRIRVALVLAAWAGGAGVAQAQQASAPVDYVIGPQDVLAIASYDQPELTGRFAVEADGTFTYPLIGRLQAGGRTLRVLEAELEGRLVSGGFFLHPEISIAVAVYRSQKIFVIGEVRQPGAYALSGEISLMEAVARAGAMTDLASGEVVIARAGSVETERVSLRDFERGATPPVRLDGGDAIFVLRAQPVYVFGHVREPGAYPLPEETMLLQALSMAGGLTTRASASRIQVVRMVGDRQYELRVGLLDMIQPGDTIIVPERFF